MGLIFDAYGSHLQRQEAKGHESDRRIAEKLQANQDKTGHLLYGKSTAGYESIRKLADEEKPHILQMPDEVFESEKERAIGDMLAKNPKLKINQKSVQKEIRKEIAKKYGVKEIRTRSDYRAAKKKLVKKAGSQAASMRSRVKIYAHAADGGARLLKEQGGAHDKDIGTEALEALDRNTGRLRRRAAEAAFTPQSSLRVRKLSKLEKKKGRLEEQHRENIMKEFFNNVHKDEDAAIQGLGLSRKPQAYRSYREARISKFSKENKKIIQREMQKKRNRLQYRMAAAGNGSSEAARLGRRALFSRTSFSARTKAAAKKLFAAAASTVLFICAVSFAICIICLAGMVFFMVFGSSASTSSWTNMTAIVNDFTQKETSFVVSILNSKNPSSAGIDEYEWYVIVDGTETEVMSETDILDIWKGIGQADQNKLMAFISTMQTDATQENAEWLIDAVLAKMYSLSIEVEEREEDIPGCGCGCQDSPPSACTCGAACAGAGDTETTYVQVTKFYINNLDAAIEQLYSQYAATEDKKQELESFYAVYQATRGGQTSLGNPLYYHWHSGTYSVRPSSYSGWRFLDRGDGNGYTVELHKGLDIPAWEGAGLFMPFDGTVQETGYDDARGNYVIMLNESGNTKVTYKHMATIMAAQGDVKGRATRVGSAGNTGDSTGAHLHIDIQLKDDSGHWAYVNPLFAVTDELPYKNSYGEGAAEDEME